MGCSISVLFVPVFVGMDWRAETVNDEAELVGTVLPCQKCRRMTRFEPANAIELRNVLVVCPVCRDALSATVRRAGPECGQRIPRRFMDDRFVLVNL